MHYRNGREAKNGDKIISLDGPPGEVMSVGTLRDATPGNDYCNGYIQQSHEPKGSDPMACEQPGEARKVDIVEGAPTDLGATVLGLSPGEFGKLIAAETEKWGRVIRAARIKPE